MIKEAIEKILSLAPANVFELDGRTYTDRQMLAVQEPKPSDVDVTTLSGFVDLIEEEIEGFDKKSVLVHVVNHEVVKLISKQSDSWGRRQTFITAKLLETKGFNFGNFIDHENFVIGVLANFTKDADRDYVVRIASNLTQGAVRTSTDDGISQEVTVKSGVTLKGTEELRNRVQLAPFRTFREVKQPISEFVFRVRQRSDEVPTLALFEADGGKWKIDAIENVARYLSAAIKDIPVIS